MSLDWGKYEPEQEDSKYLRVSELKLETEKAYGIEGTDGKTVFLPKSICSMRKTTKGEYLIEIPSWLAKKYENLEYD